MKPAKLSTAEAEALRTGFAAIGPNHRWSPPRGAPGGKPLLREPATQGFIYFIRAGDGFQVKIGWALDPKARLAVLQTGATAELKLVRTRPGTRADEAALHRRFASVRLRARGEWFHLSPDLRREMYRKP